MKTAATLLLILLVSMQTPVGQLFKLPLLVEHFLKHQKQEGVSLFGFLVDHYKANHKDADFPEDEQLPFKNISFYSISNAIVPEIVQTNLLVSVPSDKKIIFRGTYLPQQHLASIFRPPRV